MTDEDKKNVMAFYVEIDSFHDVPEGFVQSGDEVVSYIETTDEDEETGDSGGN